MASGKHLKKGKLRTWWGEAGMMDRILLLLGVDRKSTRLNSSHE